MRELSIPFIIHMTNSSTTFDHESTPSTSTIDVHDGCEDFKGNPFKDYKNLF
jgi:hypothetical protein